MIMQDVVALWKKDNVIAEEILRTRAPDRPVSFFPAPVRDYWGSYLNDNTVLTRNGCVDAADMKRAVIDITKPLMDRPELYDILIEEIYRKFRVSVQAATSDAEKIRFHIINGSTHQLRNDYVFSLPVALQRDLRKLTARLDLASPMFTFSPTMPHAAQRIQQTKEIKAKEVADAIRKFELPELRSFQMVVHVALTFNTLEAEKQVLCTLLEAMCQLSCRDVRLIVKGVGVMSRVTTVKSKVSSETAVAVDAVAEDIIKQLRA